MNFPYVFTYFGDNFVYGVIPAPHSTPIVYLSLFMESWGYISPSITAVFICFCYVFQKIILGYQKKIISVKNVEVEFINQAYNDILILNANLSMALNKILLITFIILAGIVFCNAYDVMFNKSLTTYTKLYGILCAVFALARFLIICTFASSVSTAAFEFKNSVHNIPIQISDKYKYYSLTIKMNENFVGLKILDSIILDKSLILVFLGSLMSYGIIIATFDRT